jgi:hypothetical protein
MIRISKETRKQVEILEKRFARIKIQLDEALDTCPYKEECLLLPPIIKLEAYKVGK